MPHRFPDGGLAEECFAWDDIPDMSHLAFTRCRFPNKSMRLNLKDKPYTELNLARRVGRTKDPARIAGHDLFSRVLGIAAYEHCIAISTKNNRTLRIMRHVVVRMIYHFR